MTLLPLLGLAVMVAPPQRLGLAPMLLEGGGEEDFLRVLRQQIRIGLDGAAPSVKWDEFENQNGKPLDDAVNGAKIMGQDVLLTLAIIDTLKRRLPGDVAERDWDDPLLVERFDGFLGKVAAKIGNQVKWLSLGNEVDGYLAQHPNEVDSYLRFLAHAREVVKKASPSVQVGVTVMCMEGMKNRALLQRLQQGMDVTIFTYYPTKNMQVCDLSEVPGHFQFMLDVAGSRPLLIQEIGYPTATECGSSEDKQAQFVKAVFVQLDRYTTRIPLAVYFMQSDFPPSLMGMLEQYYGISDLAFLAFLRSLGLMDAKGHPKAGWNAFRAEVLKRKPV